MQDDLARVEEIFNQALSFGEGPARAQFLSQACGANTAMRQRVEALLASHDSAVGGILDLPHIERRPGSGAAISEAPGSTIGRYKLLQQIGEGGFGVVFMAEQEHPVRRRVALKIIKLGMDTHQVIARFEAERQALAMMEHPNIARVLDAGATETGRPYFVMELVKGVPITQYCDEHHLTPRDRLALFVSICHAVQHAHQKGIIHRDLKPSNVLVAEYDERPVPKVIDFGVAKAVGQQLTDKTMFTAFGQVIGTMEYMSPEHAKLNQLDIDTRSDVYSLGVILYELLTGQTPFDRKRLQSAAFDEMLRIIREEEPLSPSTQLSRGQTLASVAAKRHTEPARLTHLIRGELDWIVMKSLDKDRAASYETANGLAMDLQRYLANEPVLAAPASAGYRFRKLARRNKGPLAATAAVVLALVIGLSIATWQAVRAADGERRAQAEAKKARAVAEVLTTIISRANAYRPGGGEYTVLRMMDEFTDRLDHQLGQKLKQDPQAEMQIRILLGHYYQAQFQTDKSARQLDRAIEILRQNPTSPTDPALVNAMVLRGWNEVQRGQVQAAEGRAREAVAMAERLPPAARMGIRRHADALQLLQVLLVRLGRYDEADVYGHRALHLADIDADAAGLRAPMERELSNSAAGRSQPEEAERYARAAIKSVEKTGGLDQLGAAWCFDTLANRLNEQGKFEEAELNARRALTIMDRELGADQPRYTRDLLTKILTSRGDEAGLAKLRAEQQALTAKRASTTRP